MNKKWFYLFVLLVVVTIVSVRIYQVNVSAFTYKDTMHSLNDQFKSKGYSFQVKKVYEMSEAEVNKQKKANTSLFIEESDTILSVNLTVKKNGKTDEKLVMGQFQLNKGAFVRYADNSLIQTKNNKNYTLNFIVPKDVVHSKDPFYLALPIGMWQKEKRDFVKFNF